MECIVCRVSEPIERIAQQYAMVLFQAIAPAAIDIFQAFFLLWVMYQLIFKAILQGDMQLAEVLKRLCLFAMIIAALKNHSMLWDLFYRPMNEAVEALTHVILKTGIGGESYRSYGHGMVGAVDGIFQQVSSLGKQMLDSYNPFQWAGGLFVMFIYVFVGAISAAYILEYIFTVFLISSFSPILLIALGFPSTRGNATRGLQCILGSALTIFFSVVGMSLTLVVSKELFSGITADGTINASAKDFAWGADFMAILMLGLVSILQQLKSKVLASNLAGINDGPGVAAAVAGVATSAIVGGSKLASLGVSKGASKAYDIFQQQKG